MTAAQLLRTIEAQAVRIAALKQAAAPFVAEANDAKGENDTFWVRCRSGNRLATFNLPDLRALARAAGGDNG